MLGRPWILFNQLAKLNNVYGQFQFSNALPIAKDCISRYEAAASDSGVNHFGDVSLTSESVSRMYGSAADTALHTGDAGSALTWARKAFATKPDTDSKVILLLAMVQNGMQGEVLTFMKTNFDNKEFMDRLKATGILVPLPTDSGTNGTNGAKTN